MWRIAPPDVSYPHRLGQATLMLTGDDGLPLADAEAEIAQTRHAFMFGNIGFELLDHAAGLTDSPAGAALAADWLELFNTATLPFYLGQFEPERGHPDTARLMAAAQWFRKRNVVLKGHPLVWHTVQPAWLRDMPLDEVEATLRGRVRREVKDFAGLIDMWDAINEAVIMPLFTAEPNGGTPLALAKGRIAMIRLAFEEAHAANPEATLLLNDFDLSSAYECLIEGVLEAGIPVDVIGLQTHMHQGYRGEEAVGAILDRFARYGLPLHMTETSLVSGHLMPSDIVDLNDYQIPDWPSTPEGEARQADEIVRHYRSLVAHPAVQALTYWGITDRDAWLGAPIGLLRRDGTRKPAYEALRDLIKNQWWVKPRRGRTDGEGRVRVCGFAGEYQVSWHGHTRTFSLAAQQDHMLHLNFLSDGSDL